MKTQLYIATRPIGFLHVFRTVNDISKMSGDNSYALYVQRNIKYVSVLNNIQLVKTIGDMELECFRKKG
jgi:hypothetical protein